MNNFGFENSLADNMRANKIDLEQTRKILDKYNAGEYDHIEPVHVSDIPDVDGQTIIDISGEVALTLPLATAKKNLNRLDCEIDIEKIGQCHNDMISFDRAALTKLGIALYPLLSYGILNGGSASSYFDYKKNESFNQTLFELSRQQYERLQKIGATLPKGLVPAYINPDDTPGASFIELKMRALLIECIRYYKQTGQKLSPKYFMYQMTSVLNNDIIEKAYYEYRQSPYLSELAAATDFVPDDCLTGIQPMLAAYSHSKFGKPKTVFAEAHGKSGQTLPMPGGHGQNFYVLADVYRSLLQQGKRYVYLGNVDNLGNTIDPVALALLALQHKQAGFDFSFRTAVDIKGGILIKDQYNRLNCADIGPAISAADVLAAESSGKRILFNCATGLFDLEYLVNNLDSIINNLPVRFSDQDKDAGLYSQAEQVTWEVIGILDDFLIFGVDKYQRFLAAKLVLENLMASGVALENPEYPTDERSEKDLRGIAQHLNTGLRERLATVYGMKLENGHWIPKKIEEL